MGGVREKLPWPAAGLVMGLLGSGCGDEAWESGRPRIEALTFLQQAPFERNGLEFALTFTDDDGDVGQGFTRLLIASEEAAVLDNGSLFAAQVPVLDPGATQGVLELLVRLDGDPQPSDRIEFGFELVDGRGRGSNRPTLTLEVIGGL
jgi:hypothetical protein